MRKLGDMIMGEIPELGFALMVFEFNDNPSNIANYISNAKRDDMIKMLEEKVKVLKHNRDFSTPEEN